MHKLNKKSSFFFGYLFNVRYYKKIIARPTHAESSVGSFIFWTLKNSILFCRKFIYFASRGGATGNGTWPALTKMKVLETQMANVECGTKFLACQRKLPV